MEDSQSVVMKKGMPELERLQLRKDKRGREVGKEEEDKIQRQHVKPNVRTARETRLWVSFISAIPPSVVNPWQPPPAPRGAQELQSWIRPALLQKRTCSEKCFTGGTSTLQQSWGTEYPQCETGTGGFRETVTFFLTGIQRIYMSSPGGEVEEGASQAQGTAGTKDRSMKQHHSVSQQGGYCNSWRDNSPLRECLTHCRVFAIADPTH